MYMFHTHALIHSSSGHPRTAHLGLPLLQKGLESLLCGSTFVVVADDQDDVVPAELTHHVEPHVRLVRVRRHSAQEGKMNTLRRRKQNGGRVLIVLIPDACFQLIKHYLNDPFRHLSLHCASLVLSFHVHILALFQHIVLSLYFH